MLEFDNGIDWNLVNAIDDEKPADKKPVKFAVIDAETDPFNGVDFVAPFIWGFYDGDEYREFSGPYCTENLAEFLAGFKGRVFAHNGGKFDFHFLIEYLDKQKSLTVINGRIAKARLGQAVLHDSFCLLPVPLSALEKQDFDYTILAKGLRDLPENKRKISEYLKSDCENLYKYCGEFIARYGLNLTLAASALNEWKRLGGFVPKSNKKYYDKFASYYYGGRVEPFKSGVFDAPFKVYDIKSAYPYAMKHKHPIGIDYFETRHVKDSEICQSMLHVKCKSNGALPKRIKNELCFPHITDEFFITGWEFVKGIENGTIQNAKILNGYVFTTCCTFGDYVDHFYKMKSDAEKRGDKAERTFAKLFLNSLYGKFGANPANYEEFYLDDFGKHPKDDFNPGPVIGDYQLFSRDLPESKYKYYNIVTAASITGFVRAYLWDNICKCDNVIYCDTDSIICADGSALDIGSNLGQWEKEGEAHRVAIAGKKLYACFGDFGGKKEKTASKGVKLTAKEIERIARGDVIQWKSEAESFSLKTGRKFIARNVKKTC